MKSGCLPLFVLVMCVSRPVFGTTLTGYIAVDDPFHFISNTPNDFGEYVITMDSSSELLVSFDPSISPFSMTEVNATGFGSDPDPYPYVGGIVGFADVDSNMAIGSYNYAFLGGTTATAPNAPPTDGDNSFSAATGIPEQMESAIWTLSADNVLSPQWINTDLSNPSTFVVDSGGILALTGDPTAFEDLFGGNADTLIFVCTDGCDTAPSIPEPSTLWMIAGGLSLLLAKVLSDHHIHAGKRDDKDNHKL